MNETAKWVWLPEDELVLAVVSPDRAELIVAAAVESATGLGMILVASGDGRVRIDHPDRFEPSGTGLAPDFTRVRPADYGRTLALGEYEASAEVVLDESEASGTLFEPADYDGSQVDPHATPEQVPLLDRAVAVLNRAGESAFTDADRVEWRAVIAGLRETIPGLYGSEWIHRGWNLMLHGQQMFTDRWTPEVQMLRSDWWEKFLAGPKPKLVTRRIPEVSAAVLK